MDGNITHLDEDGTQALFNGKLDGLVALCFENERPLHGLAGLLDWHFLGGISFHLRRGAIAGKTGECAYIPLQKNNKTYHVILVGAGYTFKSGVRESVPNGTWDVLKKNLLSLHLDKIGLSLSDFGGIESKTLEKKLGGIKFWTVR